MRREPLRAAGRGPGSARATAGRQCRPPGATASGRRVCSCGVHGRHRWIPEVPGGRGDARPRSGVRCTNTTEQLAVIGHLEMMSRPDDAPSRAPGPGEITSVDPCVLRGRRPAGSTAGVSRGPPAARASRTFVRRGPAASVGGRGRGQGQLHAVVTGWICACPTGYRPPSLTVRRLRCGSAGYWTDRWQWSTRQCHPRARASRLAGAEPRSPGRARPCRTRTRSTLQRRDDSSASRAHG